MWSAPATALLAALVVLVPACGGSGDGGEDIADGATEPPDGRSAPAVVLANLSATMEGDNVSCATNGAAVSVSCPDYYFRFVVQNPGDEAIAAVDYLRLGFGSEELYNETPGVCTLEPWAVAAGAESELIRVHFTYTRESSTHGDFKPRFYYPCGGGWTRSYAPGPYEYGDVMPSLPTAGIVTLTVQGILDDGTSFTAEAPTALNL